MQDGPLQVAQVVAGKYVIERELGRGGMGAVYLVRHRGTGKQMALKCLLPELLHNVEFVERFLREAQVGGRVHHRNVIDVFDVGRDGDVLYLVMELLEGKSLTALFRDESITLEEALLIIVRAMEGVAAVHAHGIIHRDLKPDNIFITYGTDGRLDHPKVLDFGISKLDGADQGSLTQSGMAMGTPYYMCVEQLSGHRDLDQRVDVYAMGVILYEAIAGVPPHLAESISALAIKLLTEPPVHLEEFRPDLPPGLASVIMQAISLRREQRQPTLQALIDALRPFVRQASGVRLPEGSGRPLRTPRSDAVLRGLRDAPSHPAANPAGPGPGTPPRVDSARDLAASAGASRRARSGWTPALVGAACALLLGLGGYFVWRGQGQAGAERAPDPPTSSTATRAVPVPRLDAPAAPAPEAPAASTLAQQAQQTGDAGSVATTAPRTPPLSTGDAGPGPTDRADSTRAHPRARDDKHHRPHAGRAPEAAPSAVVQPNAAAPGAAPKPQAAAAPEAPVQGRAGAIGKEDF